MSIKGAFKLDSLIRSSECVPTIQVNQLIYKNNSRIGVTLLCNVCSTKLCYLGYFVMFIIHLPVQV